MDLTHIHISPPYEIQQWVPGDDWMLINCAKNLLLIYVIATNIVIYYTSFINIKILRHDIPQRQTPNEKWVYHTKKKKT